MTWSLKELKNALDNELLQQSNEVINSIADSVDIFEYHLLTAKNAIEEAVPKNDPYLIESFDLVFGLSDNQKEFNKLRLMAKANLIASVYAARAMYDYFAELVRVIVMKKKVPNCNIYIVRDQLTKCELKTFLEDLLDSSDFNYINSFINTTKHRQLIKHKFEISLNKNESKLVITEFTRNGKKFNEKTAMKFLEELTNIKNSISNAGNILNKMVIKNDDI